ncbi:MAG: hypothetical protein KQH63_11105 [Desulfobulbaceae bacterium]|nr:hypothetical protein [Desulfobulbaceae bacterium]
MKWGIYSSVVCIAILGAFACTGSADAVVVQYQSPQHTFSKNDLLGQFDGTGYVADPSIICESDTCNGEQPKVDIFTGITLYPIDTEFAFWTTDFVGAERKTRDGIYDDGWIGDYVNANNNQIGVVVANPQTPYFKTGTVRGSVCAGLGGSKTKCSAEKYSVMEHVLTCTEKIPYFYTDPSWESICQPLSDEVYFPSDPSTPANPFDLQTNESDLVNIVSGRDYSITKKDDGKLLFRWGTIHKRPSEVRLYTTFPTPNDWKVPGANYHVTRAELIINHKITNSPNDQIRPEDFENEGATGRLPGFIDTLGVLTSDKDCYEGDGHFIPAGTLFKDPALADPPADSDGDGQVDSGGWSSDLASGTTNAWYTTTDRDPFEDDPVSGKGPRYRLRSGKFGQNIPAVDIPIVNCTEPPIYKYDIKYPAGALTTTRVSLLDWADGESPLAWSENWATYNDLNPYDPTDTVPDGISWVEGMPLTQDLDLALFVKGEYKPTVIYNATLLIEYEDPAVTDQIELCADGIDNDGDLFIDCADTDCYGAWCPETYCMDGWDNDGDGYTDCEDPDCSDYIDCTFPDENCVNTIDDDSDGLIDCMDPDCRTFVQCRGGEICSDELDNDLDGLIDCNDTDCVDAPSCNTEFCSDGVDNDEDTLIDCDDPDCVDAQACNPELVCDDLLDNDGDLMIDCADPDCNNLPLCLGSSEVCGDGNDNDGDSLVDCDDPDCVGALACTGEICNDGVDNDQDGMTDCVDDDCDAVAYCNPEMNCIDGLDNDLDGAIDCNDNDCFNDINCQPMPEQCSDFLDNDHDGLVDCADPDCVDAPSCTTEDCTDGIDNNGDGLIDCEDPGCAQTPTCTPEICDDGIDNDGDGAIDCSDTGCYNDPVCLPDPELCADLVDNDGDGFVDCDDPDCADNPGCLNEICNDGIDNNGNSLIDCADPDCADARGCAPSEKKLCRDGFDNDGDGLTDCSDPDCARDKACR